MIQVLKKILLLFVFTFVVINAYTQVSVIAKLDSSKILIGDQVHLLIEVNTSPDLNIEWPVFSDTLTEGVVVLQQTNPDSGSGDDGSLFFTQMLTITSWDSGYYAIPPIRFNYRNSSDTILHFVESDPMLLEVMPLEVDMQADIKGIKGVIGVGITFMEILPYIIISIVLGVLIVLLLRYLKKRKNVDEEVRPKIDPKVPPHIYAYDSLEELEKKKLWQNGHIKVYYSELTEIIRTYLDLQFGVYAMEMTSDEILEEITNKGINNGPKELLTELLNLADMVKFAKLKPINSEHELSMKNAYNFIKISYNNIKLYSKQDPFNDTEESETKEVDKNLIEQNDV